MQTPEIKCHPFQATPPANAFFILSKGHNTGRPSLTRFRNCFVLTSSPDTWQSYYWLVYSLWAGRRFEPYLCGSVIEFIHIKDLKRVIADHSHYLTRIDKIKKHLEEFTALETNLKKQLKLVQMGYRSLLKAV